MTCSFERKNLPAFDAYIDDVIIQQNHNQIIEYDYDNTCIHRKSIKQGWLNDSSGRAPAYKCEAHSSSPCTTIKKKERESMKYFEYERVFSESCNYR
jgi:hypothetical protein